MKSDVYSGKSVSIRNSVPPHGKLSLSSVSRVFVLLLIALVAIGCLAGGVMAGEPNFRITLNLNNGYYDGNYDLFKDGSTQDNSQTYDSFKLSTTSSSVYALYYENGSTQQNLYECLNNEVIKREGYKFRGWSIDSDPYSDVYFNESGVYVQNPDPEFITGYYTISPYHYEWNSSYSGSVTFYAIWSENTTKVILDTNQGSFEKPSWWKEEFGTWDVDVIVASIWTSESKLSGFEDYATPTRDGYSFGGWAVTENGDTVIVKEGDVSIDPTSGYHSTELILEPENYDDSRGLFKISGNKWVSLVNEGEVTLYAKWEKIPEEPVNNNNGAAILSSTSKYRDSVKVEYCYAFFDANGGEGVMEEQQFTVGEPRALEMNLFTYEDRPFEGWALEPYGGVVYTDGQEITLTENTKLYAVWGIPEIEDVPVEPSTSPLGILGILGGLGAAVVLRRR